MLYTFEIKSVTDPATDISYSESELGELDIPRAVVALYVYKEDELQSKSIDVVGWVEQGVVSYRHPKTEAVEELLK